MITMVVASTGLRYWQEMKSMVQALRLVRSIVTRVRVIRVVNGRPQELEIDQKEVVPGNILAMASQFFSMSLVPMVLMLSPRWRCFPWRFSSHFIRGIDYRAGIPYRRIDAH